MASAKADDGFVSRCQSGRIDFASVHVYQTIMGNHGVTNMGKSDPRYGRIIWARLADRNGHKKERPCAILTPTALIGASEPLLAVAITTSFPDPAPAENVSLPWNNDPRRVGTRLPKRSAAVITWIVELTLEDILQVGGQVPLAVMNDIRDRVRASVERKEH